VYFRSLFFLFIFLFWFLLSLLLRLWLSLGLRLLLFLLRFFWSIGNVGFLLSLLESSSRFLTDPRRAIFISVIVSSIIVVIFSVSSLSTIVVCNTLTIIIILFNNIIFWTTILFLGSWRLAILAILFDEGSVCWSFRAGMFINSALFFRLWDWNWIIFWFLFFSTCYACFLFNN